MDGGDGANARHCGSPAVHAGQLQLVGRNPALKLRRPKVDYESRTLGLDRNELGAFLVQAGLGSPRDHALASLLALNGLRIPEALGADVADLDFEGGHRTLKIVRKGGKHATIPLAPRTSTSVKDERAHLPRRQGRTHGPLRRRPHREALGPSGRDRQEDQPHCLRHSFTFIWRGGLLLVVRLPVPTSPLVLSLCRLLERQCVRLLLQHDAWRRIGRKATADDDRVRTARPRASRSLVQPWG